MVYYAHSKNSKGERHDLVQHLRGVAALAKDFGVPISAQMMAYYLGLWHDLGKFHPAWQAYLLASESDPGARRRGPDHKAAGVHFALDTATVGPCALLIQGHHGGLRHLRALQSWLHLKSADGAAAEALVLAHAAMPDLEPAERPVVPPQVEEDALAAELFLRLLFSALVEPAPRGG